MTKFLDEKLLGWEKLLGKNFLDGLMICVKIFWSKILGQNFWVKLFVQNCESIMKGENKGWEEILAEEDNT